MGAEFATWLIPKVGKFPRDLRFTLGERVERQTLLVLESLIRARYERDRVPRLDQANVELEILRFLLRIAHDLRALPIELIRTLRPLWSDLPLWPARGLPGSPALARSETFPTAVLRCIIRLVT